MSTREKEEPEAVEKKKKEDKENKKSSNFKIDPITGRRYDDPSLSGPFL